MYKGEQIFNLGLFLCLYSLLLPIKSFNFDLRQNSCHQLEEKIEVKTFQKFGKTSETTLSYEDVFHKYYDLFTKIPLIGN